MAHHGYIPALTQYLSNIKNPRVLEIGIDRGVTMIPLVTAMASSSESFQHIGVDIKVQEALRLTINYMPQPIPQSVWFMEENSLETLPKLVEQGMKFDLILLDGDHNYYTVAKELEYIDDLLLQNGILVVDDYSGRWSEKDLFYSERPGYEEISIATNKQETEKHGVKSAVDEWLEKIDWHSAKPIPGEPILISRNPFNTQ